MSDTDEKLLHERLADNYFASPFYSRKCAEAIKQAVRECARVAEDKGAPNAAGHILAMIGEKP